MALSRLRIVKKILAVSKNISFDFPAKLSPYGFASEA